MSTLITAPAHGLTAGQGFYFGNVFPDATGIVAGQVYYVLATDLDVDHFRFAESPGGAEVSLDLEVESAVVSPIPVYTAVSDPTSPNAPPTVPDAPVSGPTLSSSAISGIVRLTITLGALIDSATRIRSTEAQLTHKYDGSGNPDWTYAQEITLVAGTTEFTMPCLPSTSYSGRMRYVDVFGNMSDWSPVTDFTTMAGNDALYSALTDLANDVQDGAITETKIADGSISTPKLQAGSVTADILAATIVLASLIQTAISGQRIEIDGDGIRLFSSSEELLVNIPTDSTQPVYFKGQITAEGSLISDTAATLYGTNTLPGSSVTTLANGISAPTNAPSLTAGVLDYLTLASTPADLGEGIAYDTTDGSFWVAADPTLSGGYVAHHYSSAGAWIESITATGSTTTYTTTAGSTSHVSDTADGLVGTTDSHIASPITMPTGRSNMQITKVAVYMAGRLGTCSTRVGIWNSSGTLLRESATFTAADGGATTVGASDLHNVALSSPYPVSSGATVYAGFRRMNGTDGSQHDKDDGSGKSTYSGDGTSGTATGWGVRNSASKINTYVTYTYDVDTRVETAKNVGIATDGTYIWTLDTNGKVWAYNASDLSLVSTTPFDASSYITGTKANAGLFYDATAGKLVITTASGVTGTDHAKFVLLTLTSGTPSYSSAITASGDTVNGSTDTFRGGARVNDSLNSSHPTWWVPISGTVQAYDVNGGTTAVYTSNRSFGTTSSVLDGLTFDGTVFRGWAIASPTKVWKFTTWDWTTASAVYWVGYSWYDDVGTTHETALGPLASVTMNRRSRLLVQTATIPTGGVDDPDKVRVYMLPSASSPGAGTLWLQVTDALTSRYVSSYTGSGTHDGAGTAFPAGTPAEIKSSATGWSLKGDGSVSIDASIPIGGKPPTKTTKFTSGTLTWNKPTGLSFIIVECVGGGGAGGGAAAPGSSNHTQGAGGGSGGYSRSVIAAASLSSSYTITVGVGGTGSSGATGGNGGDSSFGSLVIAKGGSGGSATAASALTFGNTGGAGGVVGTGDIAMAGTDGGMGFGGGNFGTGGTGAPSVFGGGGAGGAGTAASSSYQGAAGSNGGGGGGSGANTGAAAKAGGNGGVGLVIVTEFYGA